MELVTNTFQKLMTGIGLITAFGVFVHDGRVDKAAITAFTPANMTSATSSLPLAKKIAAVTQADAHTHPDHNAAVRGLLGNSFTYQSPSVPPRKEDVHKLSLRQIELGGRHAFDNANLPVLD